MASSTAIKAFFSFFLIAIFSSGQAQARDSHFFNKVSTSTSATLTPAAATTTTNEQPLNANQPQEAVEPTFQPENDNSYGLYGHESGQLTPSATTSADPKTLSPAVESKNAVVHKYLPKNYNPVAYVTVPEDETDPTATPFTDNTFTGNLNSDSNSNEEVPYYAADNQPQYTNSLYGTNNYHYNGVGGGSSFNSEPQGVNGGENYFLNYAGEEASFRPQGMSDTRFLENGKYYYDINSGTYNGNHPYENLKRVRARNEYSGFDTYGNGESFNAMNGNYQNQYEEDTLP